ncbi:MAG: LysR family transcriptional regulator [Sneathiella sp.]|nr:LysR family transcriptional regulator [Sneathiella sp.]
MDWNQIKVFAAVAAAGSLSGAARELRMSQPTVGRYVDALEQTLNVRLFDREPRGYAITVAGERLLPQVATMERAAYALKDTSNSPVDQMTGTVRITASEMSSRFIGRRLADLRDSLPGVCIEVLTTNKIVNMSRREADIAIRASMPTTGDLRVKQVFTGHMAAYASREYVTAHPEVLTEERYSACDWIVMMGRYAADIPFKQTLAERNVTHFPIQCASVHTMVEAVLGGAGAALLFTEYAADIPDLIQVSPVIDDLDLAFWMVAHAEVLAQPRVRAVWNWLDKIFSQDL